MTQPKPDLNLEFEAFIAMGETDPKIKRLVDAMEAWYRGDKEPWNRLVFRRDGLRGVSMASHPFLKVFGENISAWSEFCVYMESRARR